MAVEDSAFISWKGDYETGVSRLDRQHMRLVDLINRLYMAMEVGTAADSQKVLRGLIDYTVTHFSDEEKLQERHGYPEFTAHRKLHQELVAEVLGYARRLYAEEPGVEAALLWFLKDWLLNHIMREDVKVARHILGR